MSETFHPLAETQPLPRLADLPIHGSGLTLSPSLFTGLARIAEGALIAATGYVIAALYVAEPDLSATWYYFLAPVLTAALTVGIFQMLQLYHINAITTLNKHWPRLALGWLTALGALVSVVFFMKAGADFSRVWVATWFGFGLGAIFALRHNMQRLALRAVAEGRFARRAVIYGSGVHAAKLLAGARSRCGERCADLRTVRRSWRRSHARDRCLAIRCAVAATT